MNFTIYNIMNSIAEYLKTGFPDISVYAGENQQATKFPCFFIKIINPEIQPEVGGFWMRDIWLDVIYLQRRNEINSNLKLFSVQEWLDENMGLIPVADGIWVHTYEREASVQDQDLHYKLHLRNRVYIPRQQVSMEKMEELNVRKK